MKACKLSEYIIQRIYEINKNIQPGDAITQLKLQKSLYFIYVYFLVNKQKKIFNDKFERWDYGPVIKDVYDKYKKYEKNPIEIPKNKIKLNELTNLEILELDSLLFELNKFSAFGLANLSHECEPWKQTPKNEYISDEKIINYYSNNLSELLNLNHYTLLDLNIIPYE